MTLLLFVAGLVLLVVGAELLVRGASRLAIAVGISPLIIGLTVVAFGTSAPELAVSVKASLDGQANIAVGNVVGSNIFNVLFILGLSALLVPLVVSRQLLRVDVPLMIAASLLVTWMAWDGVLSRAEGAVLFSGILLYTGGLAYYGMRQGAADKLALEVQPPKPTGASIALNVALIVVGLAMLVLGSRWLVQSATVLAEWMGVSDLVIGLTIVAAGTSLPEVVTSVVAGLRGERDIAVGNVVGSNLFNILCVLGLTAVVAPAGIAVAPAALALDLPVMIAVALVCLPIFFTGGEISRWEGLLLLGYYGAYTTYLVLAASHHPRLDVFTTAVLYGALPLTGAILLGSVVWGLRPRPAT